MVISLQRTFTSLVHAHAGRTQNLLLTGAAGCGKSYLACALGRYFIRQGMCVRYYRLKTLLEDMRLAQADSTTDTSC